MRYLRMLSNSAFAGLLAAVYVTLLLLLLNPEVPLAAAGPVLAVIVLSYGIHITVFSYAMYALRQITVIEPSPPGWISLRLLTWSAAALSGTASVITWLHAAGLRNALDPRALPPLRLTATLFGIAAFAFLILGLAQMASRQRSRTVAAILFTVATISSIAAPLWVRGAGLGPSMPVRVPSTVTAIPAEHPRVILLCLDGASLDVISPAVAAGRLRRPGRREVHRSPAIEDAAEVRQPPRRHCRGDDVERRAIQAQENDTGMLCRHRDDRGRRSHRHRRTETATTYPQRCGDR